LIPPSKGTEFGSNPHLVEYDRQSKRPRATTLVSANENRFISFNKDPTILSNVKKLTTPFMGKVIGRDGISPDYADRHRTNNKIKNQVDGLLYNPNLRSV
jgi:hypothetical protein